MSQKIYKNDCQVRQDTLQKIFDQQSLKFIASKLNKENLKLLELGCRGHCDLIIALASQYPNLIEYTGVDDNPELIAQAAKRLKGVPLKSLRLIHSTAADIHRFDFGFFDVIYSLMALP